MPEGATFDSCREARHFVCAACCLTFQFDFSFLRPYPPTRSTLDGCFDRVGTRLGKTRRCVAGSERISPGFEGRTCRCVLGTEEKTTLVHIVTGTPGSPSWANISWTDAQPGLHCKLQTHIHIADTQKQVSVLLRSHSLSQQAHRARCTASHSVGP